MTTLVTHVLTPPGNASKSMGIYEKSRRNYVRFFKGEKGVLQETSPLDGGFKYGYFGCLQSLLRWAR
jgi:hypothetical protein